MKHIGRESDSKGAFSRSRHFRAFTLIELLVVVSIISILASIAVPNFLDAQLRAKRVKALAEMRSLTLAIESYAIDHNNKYPPRADRDYLDPDEQLFMPQFPRQYQDISALTTPIAYISNLTFLVRRVL